MLDTGLYNTGTLYPTTDNSTLNVRVKPAADCITMDCAHDVSTQQTDCQLLNEFATRYDTILCIFVQ